MPLEFRCTQCSRPLQAGDASPGTRILCAACGAFSAVPAPEAAAPIEFRCTGCNKLLRTAADTAGKQAKCPECGKIVSVPGPGAGVTAETLPYPSPPSGTQTGSPFAPAGSATAAPSDPENPYLAPTQYGQPPPYVPSGRTDPKAVASLVLGLSGFVFFCCCVPLAFPVALTGLVLGIIARGSQSRGLAIAGIVLCVVQLVLLVAYLLLVLFLGFAGGPQGPFKGW